MSQLNNATVIGDFEVRPTGYDEDEQLWTLKQYDKGLGNAGHDRMHYAPASFYIIDLYVLTTIGASASGDSCKLHAPWPFTVWALDVGCESAGGAPGTVDFRVGSGSVLDAAEDVKTAAGTCTLIAPESTLADVAYNDTFFIRGASGGGGSLVGAQAHLYCQRL